MRQDLRLCTYLGGSGGDGGSGIAVDSAGNAYVTGVTQSNQLPHSQSPTGHVWRLPPLLRCLHSQAQCGRVRARVLRSLARARQQSTSTVRCIPKA